MAEKKKFYKRKAFGITFGLTTAMLLINAVKLRDATPDWPDARTRDYPAHDTVGIVATGTKERIREGLLMLERREISSLLISGIDSNRALKCVWTDNPDISRDIRPYIAYDFQVAATGGRVASNTKENAQIGLKWLQEKSAGGIKRCVLITSEKHMTRLKITVNQAARAMGKNAPPVSFMTASVKDGWSQPPIEDAKTLMAAWGKTSQGDGQQLNY